MVAATRGNHGAGLAWAGELLGVPVTICVPHGNNPEKNAAMRGFGATLVEHGRDYDEAAARAAELVAERGLVLAHSTNDRNVIAGAATLFAELHEQADQLDAIVVAVGGGSQAVGAIVDDREAIAPGMPIFGVQATAAAAHPRLVAREAAAHGRERGHVRRRARDARDLRPHVADDCRRARRLRRGARSPRSPTRFACCCARPTTSPRVPVPPGSPGLIALREQLAGKTVGIVLSGANIDAATLRTVLDG